MRSLTLQSATESITLDGSEGVSARLEVKGTGSPEVQAQWFEGAGDGKSFRGGRTLGRVFIMPLRVEGTSESQVRSRLAKVARILSLPNAPTRVTLDLDAGSESGDRWWADMVKTSGGDWDWSESTDTKTILLVDYTLEAGDPYWTSVDQQSLTITSEGTDLGLLGDGQSLAELVLASEVGLGETTISNTGDVQAYPVWRFGAPFDGFTITSEFGEVLEWSALKAGLVGDTKATGWIEVNTQWGTVVDETGDNMYKGLEVAPRFWTVRPGSTGATIEVPGADVGTLITTYWNVRREVLF